jgi:type IV pilus assembly protein PilA
MNRKTQDRGSRGFTLIELLIVILVMAILMAIALPLYLAAVAKAETTVCRSNMQSIANAEQAFRARDSAHSYTTNLSDLPIDLGATPICPRGGTYTIVISDGSQVANNGMSVPAGGLIIQCSVADHGVYAPGIDAE